MFFTTVTGSIYVINREEMTISGGCFGNSACMLAEIPVVMVGSRVEIVLKHDIFYKGKLGNIITTSTVASINKA